MGLLTVTIWIIASQNASNTEQALNEHISKMMIILEEFFTSSLP